MSKVIIDKPCFGFSRKSLSPIVVVPNGVIPSCLSLGHVVDSLPADSISQSNPVDLFFIGRLTHQKNVERLVESFISAMESNLISPSSTLTVIGSGDLESSILSLYSGLEQVTFLGYQEDPWALVSPHSIIVIPSLWEEPGHVPIEALARGHRTFISTGCSLIDFIPDTYKPIITFDPLNINLLFSSLNNRINPALWREIFPVIHPSIARFTHSSFQESMKSLIFDAEQ